MTGPFYLAELPCNIVTMPTFRDTGDVPVRKDGRRVFVALPFGNSRSDYIWKTVEFICSGLGLEASRADQFRQPRSIMEDIWEEIRRAGIIIGDLTDLNSNVLYEVGLAHATCDSVILLYQLGQKLPFDLAGQRAIPYSLSTSEEKKQFSDHLWNVLNDLKPSLVPSVIDGKVARSQSTLLDLGDLLQHTPAELSRECVWFSGFLSTLAISEREQFLPDEQEYRDALLKDRNLLIELARKGCPLRLIISPPNPGRHDDFVAEGLETTISRLSTLLEFLTNSREPALANMQFAISPVRQKHLYIIGHISVSEGFKIRLERGYQLTLRQDKPDAIAASIAAHSILFDKLKEDTLQTYAIGQSDADLNTRLRNCAVDALTRSLRSASNGFGLALP